MNYIIYHTPMREGNEPIQDARFINVELNQIETLYDGREGCRCGCRGTYYDPAKHVRKATNFLKRMSSGNYHVESIEDYIFNIVTNEDRQTVQTIYLKQI